MPAFLLSQRATGYHLQIVKRMDIIELLIHSRPLRPFASRSMATMRPSQFLNFRGSHPISFQTYKNIPCHMFKYSFSEIFERFFNFFTIFSPDLKKAIDKLIYESRHEGYSA